MTVNLTSLKQRSLIFAVVLATGLCLPLASFAGTNKEESDKLFKLSNSQKIRGDIPAALATLDKAIALQPDAPYLHLEKSKILWEQQEDDKTALDEIDIACKLVPAFWPCWLQRSLILFRLNRIAEALDSSARAIHYGPKISSTYLNRGRLLLELKRYQDCEADLNKALKLNPNDADAHSLRAEAAMKLHHWQCAVDDSEAVIKSKGRNTKIYQLRNAWLWKAQSYAAMKQNDMAKTTMLESIKQWPDERMILRSAVDLFQSIGDKKDAEMAAKMLKRLDDDT